MTLEDKINNYQMSAETAELVKSSQLLLIAGVVGAGKNTIINELAKTGAYYRIISHTTRPSRINHGVPEKNDVDYHFINLKDATQLIDERAFVEAKYVHGNVYGTSAHELQVARQQEKIAMTDIDVQGVVEYLDTKPDTHAIFLLPPSVETWLQRLERRYGNLEEHRAEINKRFRTAYDEIKHIQADERFILVVNDDLETTVERVHGVVSGTIDDTSDYAEAVTGHLLDFLKAKI